MAAAGFGMLVLVGCGVQTYRQTLPWRDNESFWSFAVTRNPGGFGPNWNLGLHYKRLGLWRDALPWVARATQIWPNSDFAFRRYVLAVAKVYGPQAAVAACDAKVKARPRFYAAYLERGIYRERLNLTRGALDDYRSAQKLTRRNSKSWREAERRAKKLSERLGGRAGAS